jgi:hypothetical protein
MGLSLPSVTLRLYCARYKSNISEKTTKELSSMHKYQQKSAIPKHKNEQHLTL